MTIKELKEKWEELFIRFNTSPKTYLKFDYLKLIKFLKYLIENSDEGALHEDDLRTLNGENLVGDGDIQVSPVLSAGNAISLDSDTVSVTSHQYNSSKLSSAFGHETVADGKYSIVEGDGSYANGQASHAEGVETHANAKGSHSEGNNTTAEGTYSHAEGNRSKATGECAHAEGYQTEATGEASHTEGYNTQATNNYSHAEGAYTTASGECSNASGYETDAKGKYSHSEGYFTSAEGEISHAEGDNTTALGEAAHSEGIGGSVTLLKVYTLDVYYTATNKLYYSSISTLDNSASDSSLNFLAGSDFVSDSSLEDNFYTAEKGNKLAGWIGRTLYYADGSIIGIIVRFPDPALYESGDWFIIDRDVLIPDETPAYIKTGASGEASHSEGYLTDVSGKYGHSEGERTRTTGTAAHSEGTKTQAYGAYSHAEGELTQALAFGSHSEGKYTHAEGEYTHVEGYDTKASGLYAHAEGIHSSAQGEGSHAEGYNCTTDGNTTVAAHAEGKDTVATQTASHSEGINTRAEGDATHAEGIDSKALSNYAHAEGVNTFVNDHSEGSHTEGYETQINSNYSHAEGWKAFVQSREEFINRNAKVKILSYNSTTHHIVLELSEGNFYSLRHTFDERKQSSVLLKPIANGGDWIKLHNFIECSSTYSTGTIELAPRYDIWGLGEKEDQSGIKGDVSYIISNYPNAIFQVRRNEYFGYGAHAEGGETFVEGTFAHAEGEHTKALNRGAHSEGFKTQAKEKYSHSEGWYTEANNKAEHAEGRCNKSNDVHINTTVDYVDLGLPSGTLWATCNVGATNPEDEGDDYAWGEIETKSEYDWSNYKWCNGTDTTITKYCEDPEYWDGEGNPDNLSQLVLEDDVALKLLLSNWRIPSKHLCEELLESTQISLQTINGVSGFLLTGPSGLSIFLPKGGYWTNNLCLGTYGLSAYRIDAWDVIEITNSNKADAYFIRPVSSKLTTIHSVGVGESDGDHRNALEITTDGNVFIKGVGDYDGSNPQSGKSLQLLLLQLGSQEAGLAPETAIVIAAALNDLNTRINAIPQS